MSFDPRIQVQATLAKRSFLNVAVAPYELAESLAIRIGMRKEWRKLPTDNVYACEVLLQLTAVTPSDVQVLVAETILDQVVLVQGYEGDELTEVLEVQLGAIAVPYARAQVAALLLQSGYHTVTLPAQLPGEELRATERLALDPAVTGDPEK